MPQSPETEERLERAVEALAVSIPRGLAHVGRGRLPSRDAILEVLHDLQAVIFPGYFCDEEFTAANLEVRIRDRSVRLVQRLAIEIASALPGDDAAAAREEGLRISIELLESLPALRGILREDVEAALRGDPAARSHEEVLLSYPSIRAIATYRVAHTLHRHRVPLIPRMMTEHAHASTGIDIHPGARIGPALFIDHGTGVVIGETAEIGRGCKLYQGVTLGARSVVRDGEATWNPVKRHPTLEHDVTVYAHATILGGETVVGAGSTVGGNVWLVRSIPPRSTVQIEPPYLLVRHAREGLPIKEPLDYQI